MKDINAEVDTTKFVNIDDKPFDIYIGGKLARHLDPAEQQTLPVWVAQVGAKHLVDRVLQEKHGVKDTLRDSETRRTLFAQILPELAQELDIKPLPEVDFQKQIAAQVAEQQRHFSAMNAARDDQIKSLQAKLAELEKQLAKKSQGRPPKTEPSSPYPPLQ